MSCFFLQLFFMSAEMENSNEPYNEEAHSMSNHNDKVISHKQSSPSYEENVIWDLEVWKRAEQTKFKAYLKQLEYEFLNKISEEFKIKEEEREKVGRDGCLCEVTTSQKIYVE